MWRTPATGTQLHGPPRMRGSTCWAFTIDFDSTFVGGSRDVIQNILDSPALEIREIFPGTSLQE